MSWRTPPPLDPFEQAIVSHERRAAAEGEAQRALARLPDALARMNDAMLRGALERETAKGKKGKGSTRI